MGGLCGKTGSRSSHKHVSDIVVDTTASMNTSDFPDEVLIFEIILNKIQSKFLNPVLTNYHLQNTHTDSHFS